MHRRLSFAALLVILLVGCSQEPAALPAPPSPISPGPVVSEAAEHPTSTATNTLLPPTTTAFPSATIAPPTSTIIPTPKEPPTTTLLFTGVIVPARCVQAAIDEHGNPDHPYEEVREIIQAADLAVGTLNATISDFPPHTGCISTYLLVGSANNADALSRAGFDVMSVATNHIKNCGVVRCGDRAFFDTLDNLRRVGILPVGAGANHEEAMQPVVVTLNGVRFGIVSLGQIEQSAFAGVDTPGIAVLNRENIPAAIEETLKVSDVVIAMPHWGPEDVATPTYIQRNLARDLVDAGADIIVGNHTHVVQGIQEIDGVPVFYGLGNFVFDQTWARDHSQGVILLLNFRETEYLGYELIPTHVDRDGRVHLVDEQEAAEILQNIANASAGLR